ncbi:MAG: inositol monophosphatase [Myxococcales bacterium]|nr:inositol monophosphatase [Myxococcales bacterium]
MTQPVYAELDSRLPIALRAAQVAGAVLMRHFGRAVAIELKSPVELVTIADRESEAVVVAELQGAFPTDRVLAEEADGPAGAQRLGAEVHSLPWCWVVDPLDGTTNFAHGQLAFAVSIGLLHFGQPVLGVVHAPARREVFVGGVGIPPTCNGRPIRVSDVADLGNALIATGFPYDRRQRLDELTLWFRRVLERARDLRRAGAASIDLCEVAAGRLDAFYEVGLQPWDTAAGQAIVEAAGGRLTGFDGGPHDVFGQRTLASNGRLHGAVVELVAG